MTTSLDIRFAEPEDAAEMLAIYGPIVTGTAISFELEPPTLDEMRARVESTLPWFPWLVATGDGALAGYAYASRHRARPAYQWAVDVSVYVAPAARGRGVARTLYRALFDVLRELGYFTALAGIALPNAASVALHESLGFAPVGVYRRIGYKLGAWHDVGWWELALCEPEAPAGAPRPLAALRDVHPARFE